MSGRGRAAVAVCACSVIAVGEVAAREGDTALAEHRQRIAGQQRQGGVRNRSAAASRLPASSSYSAAM